MIGGLLVSVMGVEGAGKVREQNIAYGLVDAVEVKPERMGFSVKESATKRLDDMYNPSSPLESSEKFFTASFPKRAGLPPSNK